MKIFTPIAPPSQSPETLVASSGKIIPYNKLKTDQSIKNITVAAIQRHAQNPEVWLHSRVTNHSGEFDLIDTELPVFEIRSNQKPTLITTRRILEKIENKIESVDFEEIDDLIFGNFKGQISKPELSIFRVVNIFGDQIDFQMETGKASIALIYSINTIRRLRASH